MQWDVLDNKGQYNWWERKDSESSLEFMRRFFFVSVEVKLKEIWGLFGMWRFFKQEFRYFSVYCFQIQTYCMPIPEPMSSKHCSPCPHYQLVNLENFAKYVCWVYRRAHKVNRSKHTHNTQYHPLNIYTRRLRAWLCKCATPAFTQKMQIHIRRICVSLFVLIYIHIPVVSLCCRKATASRIVWKYARGRFIWCAMATRCSCIPAASDVINYTSWYIENISGYENQHEFFQ